MVLPNYTKIPRSASLCHLSHNEVSLQSMPMNTTTKKTTRKLLSKFSAAESIRIPQILSTAPSNSSTTRITTRYAGHRNNPVHTEIKTRKKGPFFNTHKFHSNSIAAFALTTILMSSSMSSSPMADAFVPTPKARIVKMDTSLIQHAISIDDHNKMDTSLIRHPLSPDGNSNILFAEVEFEKFDNILDMSSSVGTTAATSSASSFFFPEQYQYSLRKVLNVADSPYNPTAEELLHKFPKIVGHRGCLYEELENTRGGFSRCHEMGCDAVELDVFKIQRCNKSKDETTLVVFHGGGTDENPGDLLDYCGIDGSILDYNYENEIREKLAFNPDYAEFPCPVEKIRNGEIPTLEEVLMDAKKKNAEHRKMEIKIELKGPDVVEDVLELVDSLGVGSMCSYSSFDLQKLKRLRELKPDRDPRTGDFLYRTGALFNNIDCNGKILDDDYSPIHSVPNWNECDIIDRAHAVGASEIHLKYDTCKKGLIDRIHASGLGSMAWFRGPIGMNEDCSIKYRDVGNEDFSMYETVIQTGVQQLCVNKPDVLIALREKLFLLEHFKRQQQLERQVLA